MAKHYNRPASLLEKRLKTANLTIIKQQEEILTTQELSATLYESNQNISNQLLDTQEALAAITEGK